MNNEQEQENNQGAEGADEQTSSRAGGGRKPARGKKSASRFKEGQRVKFRPSHNKELELTGTIEEISEDQKSLKITAEPDGKAIEVEREFEASAEDCTEADDDD